MIATISAMAVVAACAPGGADIDTTTRAPIQRPADTIPAIPPADTFRPGIRFNPEHARVGERVGDLTIDSLDAHVAAVDSIWIGTARFRGELTLSGRTLRHPEPDVRAVCFEADSASAARMPRWDRDERRPWFCFRNVEEAIRTLAPPGDERGATVVIDQFVIHSTMSDAVNAARLVRVVQRDSTGSAPPP